MKVREIVAQEDEIIINGQPVKKATIHDRMQILATNAVVKQLCKSLLNGNGRELRDWTDIEEIANTIADKAMEIIGA